MSVGRAPICRQVWTEHPRSLPRVLYIRVFVVLFSRVLFRFPESCFVWQSLVVVFQSLVLFSRVLFCLTEFCFVFLSFFFSSPPPPPPPPLGSLLSLYVLFISQSAVCESEGEREEEEEEGLREGGGRAGRRVSDRTGWLGVGISRVGKSTFHLQLLSWCGSKYTCLSKPVAVEHVVWSWGRQAPDDNHSWTGPHLSAGMDGTSRNFTTCFIHRVFVVLFSRVLFCFPEFCFVFQSLVLFDRVLFCFPFFFFFFCFCFFSLGSLLSLDVQFISQFAVCESEGKRNEEEEGRG